MLHEMRESTKADLLMAFLLSVYYPFILKWNWGFPDLALVYVTLSSEIHMSVNSVSIDLDEALVCLSMHATPDPADTKKQKTQLNQYHSVVCWMPVISWQICNRLYAC